LQVSNLSAKSVLSNLREKFERKSFELSHACIRELYTRGFLRQPEERWMMGDSLIFTSPDVPSVPGIGWHRDI
jgi:hypothetical protein